MSWLELVEAGVDEPGVAGPAALATSAQSGLCSEVAAGRLDGKMGDVIFLLKPDGSLEWTDMPKSVLDILVERGRDFDLNKLEWKTSEVPVSDITVRLALRKGHVVKDGILMDAGPLAVEQRPTKLTNLHLEGEQTFDRLEATPSFKATEDYLESLAPGWKAESAKSRADVRDGMERSISQAQQDLDIALSKPVKPDVVEHWRGLGGNLPSEDS